MKRVLCGLILLMCLFRCDIAHGWGHMGHDVITKIAEDNLTRRAKRNIAKIIGPHSMIYFSVWMDNLQNAPTWDGGYDITKTWHYVNVDEGYTYETMEKSPTGDVYIALTQIIDGLKSGELSDSIECDYVKMLVHLIGDVHCPMHAGHRNDSGGNGFRIKWFGRDTSLHTLWDSQIIESAHAWSYTEWSEHLDIYNRKEKKAMASSTPYDWMNETIGYASDIYADMEPGEDYSYDYVYKYTPMLEHQLVIAGYRLAAILNDIFG